MKWKNRLTNYNFWVSMVSALLLVLQACDIKFDVAHINEIITAVLGLLVVIGIINDPTKTSETKTAIKETVDTPKQNSSADNQKDETNTASENDSQDTKQDVYPEVDLTAPKEVFVAETTPDVKLDCAETSTIVENNINKVEFDCNLQNVDVISNEQKQSIVDESKVENIPPQQNQESTCFKIVN